MSVKSLVQDPEFDGLSSQQKQQALSAIDPEFSKITPDQVEQVVAGIRQSVPAPDTRGLVRKGWDALAVPEQMSRQGLQQMAGFVPQPTPTGNMFRDVALGTPRVLADTAADAAPGFVSRGAILTAGAAKMAGGFAPAAKVVLRGLGRQGEELSGIAPKAEGALEAAFKDPTLIFAKGKKAAGGLYEAAKGESAKDVFSGLYKPEEILDKAKDVIKSGEQLNPVEALKARKATDILLRSKSHVPDELYKMRDQFDSMAKASKNISAADKVYQRGRQADALRNVFPQNKYGGASAFKLGIMTALENMGIPGKAALAALSPAAQGLTATAAGIGARQVISPLMSSVPGAMAVSPVIQAIRQALAARQAQQ